VKVPHCSYPQRIDLRLFAALPCQKNVRSRLPAHRVGPSDLLKAVRGWEDGAMIVITPASSDDRITLQTDSFGQVIKAIGTHGYDWACLKLFEQSLDAEHWALFHYRENDSVSCIATASRVYMAAAQENIDRFVTRCHRVDPSVVALKQRCSGQTCVTKIDIGDIRDRQYRHCFELTHVQERLSFFSRCGADLHQLSIFRSTMKNRFSSHELTYFSTLARLVLATASKHERLRRGVIAIPPHLDLEAIERCLEYLPGRLSRREREVCSRAAAGKTIEGTALELNIRKTSVITYRQRAYQKLGISRQNELVALVNNLRADETSSRTFCRSVS
jgi:DNA-binding CsgD family transcriptional regulator